MDSFIRLRVGITGHHVDRTIQARFRHPIGYRRSPLNSCQCNSIICSDIEFSELVNLFSADKRACEVMYKEAYQKYCSPRKELLAQNQGSSYELTHWNTASIATIKWVDA